MIVIKGYEILESEICNFGETKEDITYHQCPSCIGLDECCDDASICSICWDKALEKDYSRIMTFQAKKIPNEEIMEVDRKDFLKALEQWYWVLDECSDWDDEKFNIVLNKYDLTVDDLMRI